MLRPAHHTRYHIAAILAAHWISFVAQYKRWIRPVVFENVRKVLACRTPVLGCHIYQCKDCGHIELIPHSCKSRFCPLEIFMEKPSKLIPKPLLQIRKLFGFDHYSIVPLFHHSIGWHYSKWHQNKRNFKELWKFRNVAPGGMSTP